MKFLLLTRALVAALLVVPAFAAAPSVAQDDASNYTTETWATGSNGGSGFTPWVLGGGGHVVDSSLRLGGGADIGHSFGYGGEANGFANRGFAGGSLRDGQSFSVRMAFNFREGFKGVSVKSGSTDLLKLTVSKDNYEFDETPIAGSAGATGDWSYDANTVLVLTVTRRGRDLAVSIAREGGKSAAFTRVLEGEGVAVDGFSLFSYTRSAQPQNGVAFNDLSVSR